MAANAYKLGDCYQCSVWTEIPIVEFSSWIEENIASASRVMVLGGQPNPDTNTPQARYSFTVKTPQDAALIRLTF